jgi:hypothetical protein
MSRPCRRFGTSLSTWPSTPCRPRCWPGVWGLLLIIALGFGAVPGAHAESKRLKPRPGTKTTHKVPEKPTAISVTKGKVAVFAFKGDDGDAVRAEVVHILRARGLDVMTSLRPVDSAAQFREMADTLDLAAYIDGEVRDDGRKETAIVHVRSGATGFRVASAAFYGTESKVPDDVGRALWNRIGAAVARACVSASRPRKHERAPLRIEAGTPIENTPVQAQQGT